ncbi:MAG: GDSL-type esterase/lipase family protein [Verrucomicrobiota bacterium]|jgi:lysophospholipase L1-like esterase
MMKPSPCLLLCLILFSSWHAAHAKVGQESAPPVFLTCRASNYDAGDFQRLSAKRDVALQRIPPSDPRFVYEGRFDFANPAGPVVAWQASRIRIDFDGDRLVLCFDRLGGQSFFDVQVDDEAWILGLQWGGRQRLALQHTLSPGRHHLALFKRSEAGAGTVRFEGIELAPGAKARVPAPVTWPLTMEFYGDSITVGACDEDGAADQWTNRLTHNCALNYAAMTAAAFSADYRNISVSGMGIVTGYVKVRAAQVWNRTGARAGAPLADLKGWQPDLVFVNYGENDDSFTMSRQLDFPKAFADDYVALVQNIRRAYPNARIVLLRGGMFGGAQSVRLRIPWEEAVARLEAGDKNVGHFVFTHWSALHPRVPDDRAMADELIRWLKTRDFMQSPEKKR